MSIEDKLVRINDLVTQCMEEIHTVEDQDRISDLISTLLRIEDYYYDWCEQNDDQQGQLRGTTYELGTSVEFYIESLDWHDVSLILRKLDKRNEDEPRW